MPFTLVLLLAALAVMAGFAWLRLRRLTSHADPIDGWRRIALIVASLLVPPLVLQVLFAPTSGPDAVGAVVLYSLMILALVALSWVAALLIARLAPIHSRPALLMALIGRDTSAIVPFDPPMTAKLAAEVDRVDKLNSVFPRGIAFLSQISTPSFRTSWDDLDDATRLLETDIAEQRRLGLGVSERALASASDARGRLDTLHREAENVGAWAPA